MATKKCLIVADSSRARLFHSDHGKITEVAGLTHAESRARSGDLISDRPGRSFDSAGAGRHSMGEGSDPQRREAEVFAREVSAHLKQTQPLEQCDEIGLIAPPLFLGMLRKSLDPAYGKKVAWGLDKNVVTQSPEEIQKQMPWKW